MNSEIKEKLEEYFKNLKEVIKKGEELITEFEENSYGSDFPLDEAYDAAANALEETLSRIETSFIEEVIK